MLKRRRFTIIVLAIAVTAMAVIFYLAIEKRLRSNALNRPDNIKIGTDLNDIAPDFNITTIEGKNIKSSSLRGKIVVITSFAAWCPTCVMEARQLSQAYRKYDKNHIAFLTVDIDPRDSKDFIRQFKFNNNTPWYYADASGGIEIIKRYKLKRFEITYILGKDGLIRFKDNIITSSETLDEEIKKLL